MVGKAQWPFRVATAVSTAVAFFIGLAPAMPEDIQPIETRLVSEWDALVPGETAWIGLVQKMPPGFHTYWRNPGTVGLPTGIEWKLPDGFKAGPTHWPVPQVTKMAVYDVWGYETNALLVIPVSVPDNLEPGSTHTLKADVQWMSCGDQCFPGFREMSITLPVRAQASKVSHGLSEQFDRTRSQQPGNPVLWDLKASLTDSDSSILIEAGWTGDPSSLPELTQSSFFGFERIVSSAKGQTWTRSGNGFEIRAQREEFTPDVSERLRGILVMKDSWPGTDRPRSPTLLVDIPLTLK